MTTEPKRILIVEDDAGLARLFGEKLRREGFICDTGDSARDCLARLEQHTPDLMLLDYSLPDVLAPALVEQLRKAGRLPPFIVVTGLGDERVAVEVMKLGARDYLVKDAVVFDRLLAVVNRALQEVEKERRLAAAEAALRTEKDRADQYFESAAVMMLVLDHDGRVERINRRGCEILGWSREEILGCDWFERCLPPTVRDEARRIFGDYVAGKLAPVAHSESSVLTRSGGERLMAWHSNLVRDLEGRVLGSLGSAEDITERKQAEAALHRSEALFRRTFDEGPVGAALVRLDQSFQIVNAAFCRFIGYTEAELLGMRFPQITHPDDVAASIAGIRRLLAGETTAFEVEKRYVRKDGGVVWGQVSVGVIRDDSGKPFHLLPIIQDITERKRMAQALKESEERFRAVVENAPIAAWVQTELRFAYLNPAALRLLGAEKVEQLLGQPVLDRCRADFRAEAESRIRRLRVGQTLQPLIEQMFLRLDGTEVAVELSSSAFVYDGRQATVVFARDISERKRAEEALRESELQYRILADSGQALIWTAGLDKGCSYFNQPWLAFTGHPLAQELGDGWTKGVHPDDLARCFEVYSTAFDRRERFSMDYRLRRHDGEFRWIQDDGSPRYDSQRNFLGYIGHCLDITERKRTETALQESEERYRLVAENVSDVIWVLDVASNRFRYVSPSVTRLRGIAPTERLTQELEEAVPPAMREPVRARLRERLAAMAEDPNKVYIDQIEQLRRDGSAIWTEVSTRYVTNPAGRVEIFGVTRDISERRRSEVALRESEERLRVTLETTQIGVWDWDVEHDRWFASATYFTMLGYPPVTGPANRAEWLERAHPSDRAPVAARIAAVLDGSGTSYEYEARIRHADGAYRWHHVRGEVVARDPSGRPTRLVGTRMDVTARRVAEEALRQKTALLEAQLNSSIDGILVVDGQGKKVLQNRQAVELWKIPPEIVDNPDDQQQVRHVMAMTKNPEQFAAGVARLYNHPQETSRDELELTDGTILDRYSAPVLGEDGQCYGRIWVFRDITGRKRAEAMLRESEAKFATMFREAPMLIAITDLTDGRFVDVNDEGLRVSGFSRGEVIGHSGVEIGWLSTEGGAKLFRAARKHGRVAGMEMGFHAKDGHPVYGWISGERMVLGGRPCLLTVVADITELKRARDDALRHQARFRAIFESVPVGISWHVVGDTGTHLVNDEHVRITGVSAEESRKVDAFTRVTLPEDRPLQQKLVDRFLRGEIDRFTVEKRYRHSDGRVVSAMLSSRMFVNPATGQRESLATLTDITERKRAEEILAWEAALMENSADVCCVKDLDLRVRAVNSAFLKLAGVASAAEVLGKTDAEIFRRSDNEANVEAYMADERRAQMLRPGETIQREETIIRPDGVEQIQLTRKFPVFNPAGKLIATANISTDVTAHRLMEEALQDNERRYRLLFASNVAGVALHEIICDASGSPCDYRFLEVNLAFERLTGLQSADIVGRTVMEVMPQTEATWIERYGRVALTGDAENFEDYSRVLDRYFEVSAYSPQRGQFAVQVLDVTERKRAEEQLQKLTGVLLEAQRVGRVGSYDLDVATGLWTSSPVLDEIFGIKGQDFVRDVDGWGRIMHPEQRVGMIRYLQEEVIGARKPFNREYRIVRIDDGAERWLHGRGELIFDEAGRPQRMVGTIQDVTERYLADMTLRESLREKEALLKEVHHRVKNNLQVISSLLRLESGQISDPGTRGVLNNMQERVRAMALLHENLYRSGNLAQVNMEVYLGAVCQQLLRTGSGRAAGTIDLQLQLAPLRLEMNQALPCGLLVSELVSNCLKHAFPGGRGGRIGVELQPVATGAEWCLRVADDGVGLPPDFDIGRLHSLGLQLVSDLSRQIQGRLEYASPHGACFAVTFRVSSPSAASVV